MAVITTTAVTAAATAYSAKKQSDAARHAANLQAEGAQNAMDQTERATALAIPEIQQGYDQSIANINQGFDSAQQNINQGYGQAQRTITPLAQMAQGYNQEQYNLLGLGGDQAYQQSLSRIADPLQREQEQALLRNQAAMGGGLGPSGNVLSALAEQTRSRTEANIGNRLNQLGQASNPANSALFQLSNLQLGRGTNLANLDQATAMQLAQANQNRGTNIGNTYIGQGSALTQLAQNAANAQAGYSAFQAQQTPAAVQGLTAGLNAYTGAGGTFGGWGGNSGTAGSRASDYSGTAMQNWIAQQGG